MKTKSKSNLYINIGDNYHQKQNFHKNKSSKFNSLINNKSLTTNESGGTSLSKPFNTLEQNFFSSKFNHRVPHSKFSSLNIFTNYNNSKISDKYSTSNIFLPKIRTKTDAKKLFKKADEILNYLNYKSLIIK